MIDDDYADDLTSITGESILELLDPPFPTGFFGSGALLRWL